MNQEKSLLEAINEHLSSDDFELPVFSPIAAKVQALARNDRAGADQIEAVLLHDAALSSQILRIANSPFYAGLAKVDTIKTAITRLGLHEIVNVAVLCTQRGHFKSRDAHINQLMAKLWQHSLACAIASRWLALRCDFRHKAAEAFMAGLFHDIGTLVLFKALDDIGASGAWVKDLPEALMFELIRTLHTHQGARLIRKWNLSETYAQIAEQHHDERIDDGNVLALIVRLADHASLKLGLDLQQDHDIVLTALPETAALGIKEIALAELEIMLEDSTVKMAA